MADCKHFAHAGGTRPSCPTGNCRVRRLAKRCSRRHSRYQCIRLAPAWTDAIVQPGTERRKPSFGCASARATGLQVQLWATELDMPRAMRTATDGDFFLAKSGAGRIRVWRPAVNATHPGPASTFATGLEQPFGIAFWPPSEPRYVYVAETSRIIRYPLMAACGLLDPPKS